MILSKFVKKVCNNKTNYSIHSVIMCVIMTCYIKCNYPCYGINKIAYRLLNKCRIEKIIITYKVVFIPISAIKQDLK